MKTKYLIISFSIIFIIFCCCGIFKLLCTLVALLGFLLGFGIFDYYTSPYYMQSYSCQISKGLNKIIEKMKAKEPESIDSNISGNKALDKAFTEIVDLILRDYLEFWYQYISADKRFIDDVRRIIYSILSNFTNRCKDVDWVTLLTEDLPNEIGSHIKLYRLSNQYCNRSKDRNLHNEFFNLESQFYKYMCLEDICTKPDKEKDYLRELSEFIIYFVCPSEDFNVPPIRYLLRETLVNGIFLPSLDMVSDPDYVNQYIVWMCKENSYTSEYFVQSIRMSNCVEEIQSVNERIDIYHQRLRSRDSGGDDDAFIKAQLGRLEYLRKICDNQVKKLETPKSKGDDYRSNLVVEKHQSIGLEFILEFQIGISLFLAYLMSIDSHQYLNCYINVLEYRSLTANYTNMMSGGDTMQEEPDPDDIFETPSMMIKEPISPGGSVEKNQISLIDQQAYSRKILSDCKQLSLPHETLEILEREINKGNLAVSIFDTLFNQLFEILRDKYLEGFKNSRYYFNFLEEIDDSQISEEDLAESPPSKLDLNGLFLNQDKQDTDSYNVRVVDATISNNAYVLYTLVIIKTDRYGNKESWKTFRRFRDFDSLNSLITEICGRLPNIKLPSKKHFNNLKVDFMEKRGLELQEYLSNCLSIKSPEMKAILIDFLKPEQWEVKTSLTKSLVTSVGNAVLSVPDNFSRLYSTINPTKKGSPQKLITYFSNTSADSLDLSKFNDTEQNRTDNIPIRIMLLLIDEIFDLQNKSQMVRRGLLGILRRIVKTFFGEKVNKIILDKAGLFASAQQMAVLVNKFKESLWPGGGQRVVGTERDAVTKMRTRVLCRAKMLGSISDEVSQFLGQETTRQGIQRVFEMFQDPILNRRLAHTLLRMTLLKIFANHNLDKLLAYCLCPARTSQQNASASSDRLCHLHQCDPPIWKDWIEDSRN